MSIPSLQGFYSVLPNLIPRMRRKRRVPVLEGIASRLQSMYENAPGPIRTQVHGRAVLINPGNTYPFIVHDYPWFNAPLVELVHQVFRALRRPIHFLDVGAATGDTVLLLRQRCPKLVKSVLCIEGDEEFFALLQHNMREFPYVEVVKVLLARENMSIPSLVKHHRGTAAALGEELRPAVRLDSLEQLQQRRVDVLKVDVDGFDGAVLQGADGLLRRDRPAVIFEWHPKLIQRTNQDFYAGFEALKAAGYSRFLWFNNVGTFSHFGDDCSPARLRQWVEYLLRVNARADEHFDLVALSPNLPINDIALAEMNYARHAAVSRP